MSIEKPDFESKDSQEKDSNTYAISTRVKTEGDCYKEDDGLSPHEALAESMSSQESKEQEVELNVEESVFEYPEEVRESSEVKGYVRKKISWEEIEKKYPGDSNYIEKLRNNKEILVSSDLQESFINLLKELSDDLFPTETYNHLVGRTSSTSEELERQSKIEGLAAQKVFDPKTFERIAQKEEKWRTGYANLSFFNTEDNKFVRSVQLESGPLYQSSGHLLEELKGQVGDPSTYAMGDRGLSLSSKGEFWEDQDVSGLGLPSQIKDAPRLMIYGFGKENKAFRKYLKEVKGILEDKITQSEDNLGGLRNPERQLKTVRHLLGEKEVKNFAAAGSEEDHSWLPTMNGHPDLMDLRWCHSDWAYIPTKNGINVLHFQDDLE